MLSNISFPYFDLRSAAENDKKTVLNDTRWGKVKNSNYIMPATANGCFWTSLSSLLLMHGASAGISVEYKEISPDVLPSIPDEQFLNCNVLKAVLNRLNCIIKNPQSCTLRVGCKNLDYVYNAMDYIVLDAYYRKYYSYYKGNSICKSFTDAGRSFKNKSDGKPKSVGYKLCEILSTNSGTVSSLAFTPGKFESDVSRFIYQILEDIGDAIPDTYELPKSIFVTPSVVLQHKVRQGPMYKKKDKDKSNFYLPYSYFKSAECQDIPSGTRKAITYLSGEIQKDLESINNLPPSVTSSVIDDYQEYITLHYAISDSLRDLWRKLQQLPDIQKLSEVVKSTFNRSTCTPVLSAIRSFDLRALDAILELTQVELSDAALGRLEGVLQKKRENKSSVKPRTSRKRKNQ